MEWNEEEKLRGKEEEERERVKEEKRGERDSVGKLDQRYVTSPIISLDISFGESAFGMTPMTLPPPTRYLNSKRRNQLRKEREGEGKEKGRE